MVHSTFNDGIRIDVIINTSTLMVYLPDLSLIWYSPDPDGVPRLVRQSAQRGSGFLHPGQHVICGKQ